MRRRLLITYLSLLGVAVVAFLVPLSVTIASRETQGMFIDRVDDTTRFATVAGTWLRGGRLSTLQSEIAEYDKLYGIGVAIVLPDGVVRIASRAGIDPEGPMLRGAVQAALSGTRAQPSGVVWPWHGGPMVVAEPIGNSGAIDGAVVTVSPTDGLRASIGQQWAVLAAIGLMLLGVGAALAVPLGRWFARPLNELDEVTHAISRGELTERVHDDVGPPELRRLASSFNTMAGRLSTLIARQRGFISYASHQLRTPLASVRLRVENLADAAPPADAAEYRLVVDEVDRLSAIFEAVLAFARADTEEAELVDIDAGAIADDRVVAWQAMADAAGVRLMRSGAETAPARAAAQTLDQVLDVLVHNALKNVGVGATVQVAVQRDGADVVVGVLDDGPGMSEEQMAQAIRPFWRQPADRGQAGAGLGLAIAAALVGASGGRLTLGRSPAGGLAARVRLAAAPDPLAPGPDVPLPPGSDEPPAMGALGSGSDGLPADADRSRAGGPGRARDLAAVRETGERPGVAE